MHVRVHKYVQRPLPYWFCIKEEFGSIDFHHDRLWRTTLYFLRIKAFSKMFHAVRAEVNRAEGVFPDNWNEFGALLPISHVLHQETFKLIMMDRNLSIVELQQVGYTELSPQEIEQFDLGTISDFLQRNFSLREFALAAGQVMVNNA